MHWLLGLEWRTGRVWTRESWRAEDDRVASGYLKTGFRAMSQDELLEWVRRGRKDDAIVLAPAHDPRPATSLCQRRDCGEEVSNDEMEDHVRAHKGLPPLAAIVPVERQLPDGTRVIATTRGEYERHPDGRMVRRNPDGTLEGFAPCERCHRLVDVDHPHGHCPVPWCPTPILPTEPEHVHCLVHRCPVLGVRHRISHVADTLRGPDFTPSKMDELVNLADFRPVLVEETLIKALESKQDRTVRIAKKDGPCASCGEPIIEGFLIEAVRISLGGSPVWIHLFCPAPAPGRDPSREESATDQTGARRTIRLSNGVTVDSETPLTALMRRPDDADGA